MTCSTAMALQRCQRLLQTAFIFAIAAQRAASVTHAWSRSLRAFIDETAIREATQAAVVAAAATGMKRPQSLISEASRVSRKSNPPAAAQPYRMVLQNHEDVQYVGDFEIGGQTLKGVIDTGSFELLVFSKECKLCGKRRNLLYDHSKSENYRSGDLDMRHSFGSGDTWSHEAFDVVQIGPLRAENQSFWEVVDSAMPVLKTAVFQAIIGLGPPESAKRLAKKKAEEAKSKRQELIHEHMKLTKRVRQDFRISKSAYQHAKHKVDLVSNLHMPIFSICIGEGRGDPGYFIWNDTDPRYYVDNPPNPFVHMANVGHFHWSVKLTDVRIGHMEYGSGHSLDVGCGGGSGSCGAVLDSGTSLIAAPQEAIAEVQKALDKLNGDCSKLEELPDLHFRLEGHDFSLPPESYIGQVVGTIPQALQQILSFKSHRITKVERRAANRLVNSSFTADTQEEDEDSEGVCQPLLMAIDADTQFGPMWILGLPFFRRYYTSFERRTDEDGNHHRSLWTALADERCRPNFYPSLLGMKKRRRARMMRVDASELRVPPWVSDATSKRRVDHWEFIPP